MVQNPEAMRMTRARFVPIRAAGNAPCAPCHVCGDRSTHAHVLPDGRWACCCMSCASHIAQQVMYGHVGMGGDGRLYRIHQTTWGTP